MEFRKFEFHKIVRFLYTFHSFAVKLAAAMCFGAKP